MAALLLYDLEDDVVEELKLRAVYAGVSLEEQTRRILRKAVQPTRAEILADMARIRAMTPVGHRTLAEVLIREDRDSR